MPESVDDLIFDFAAHLRKCKTGIAPVLHRPFSAPRDEIEVKDSRPLPKSSEAIQAEREQKNYERKTRKEIRAELKADIAMRRAKARKELADELRNARTILRYLKDKIANLDAGLQEAYEEKIAEARNGCALTIRGARQRIKKLNETYATISAAQFPALKINGPQDYPDVPPPIVEPSKFGDGLPMVSGIYFLWSGDVVDYVGQSINLSNRLRIPGHHILRAAHRISFIQMERRELTWAECYYIGILRPKLNFGQSASHQKV